MSAATLAPPSAPPGWDLPAGYVTREEYLRFEETADTKHEWIDGEVREMAGASKRHCKLDRRIGTRIDLAFEGAAVETFSNDIKIRVPDGPYYYCDGSLAVAPARFEPPVRPDRPETVLLNPALIVEVLSDSTAHIDRGEKLDAYRTIPSLRDYLLFSQDEAHVERHFRRDDGTWGEEVRRGRAAAVPLAAAGGAELNLGAIYAVLDGPADG